MKIEFDVETGALLEKRGIRSEDIVMVLAYAEETGNAHIHRTTGHSLAYHRLSTTTYWVEYELEGDAYRIYRAYSHRMEIIHGFNMPVMSQGSAEWLCRKCNVTLALATVKLKYLDETFGTDLSACASCHRVLVSEETAMTKIAQAEQMLEDK